MKISIIIPTLNEEANIAPLLDFLSPKIHPNLDVLVVDGGSTDKTVEIVRHYNGVKILQTTLKSRAKQMNAGAKETDGEILYFVHADVQPLDTFVEDILHAVEKNADFGCYRFQFDKTTPMMRFNSWWTRFDFMFCRGGDQTLFVKRDVFNALNQFNERYIIMEDFDFIRRARRKFTFYIIPKDVIVSTRKYDHNSYFKVNIINLTSYWMFMLGASPERIRRYYKRFLVMKYE